MATNIEAPWFVLRCLYYEARLSHSLLVYARIWIVEPRHQSGRDLELVLHESGIYVKFTGASAAQGDRSDGSLASRRGD